MRWFEINSNPNSPEVLAWRRRRLDAAWRPAVTHRQEYIASLCRHRTVLDVGCVDHLIDGRLAPGGLFERLVGVAKQCVGLDVNETGIKALRGLGYAAVTGDITSRQFSVPEPGVFETIVVGEVIEHITDLETFFTNIKRCLPPDGLAIITSPNPYFMGYFLGNLKYRHGENADHVTYVFPSGVSELADRFGFTVASWRGVECFVSPTSVAQWIIEKCACAIYPKCILHCNQLIYELKPVSNGTPSCR